MWSQLSVTMVCVWTGCLESPGGILRIGDSRKSGQTLNLSLQHNPHNERIQASLHPLSCLALALTAFPESSLKHTHMCAQAHTLMLTSVNWVIWKSEGDEHMLKWVSVFSPQPLHGCFLADCVASTQEYSVWIMFTVYWGSWGNTSSKQIWSGGEKDLLGLGLLSRLRGTLNPAKLFLHPCMSEKRLFMLFKML